MSLARLVFHPSSPPPGDRQAPIHTETTPATKILDDLIAHMARSVEGYDAARDRRALFLAVYLGMTERLRDSVVAGRFLDDSWIAHLAYRFAGMYFDAEGCFDTAMERCPEVWRRAFDLTVRGDATALECVLLGMNAHIGYDLPQAIAGMLRDFDLDAAEAGDAPRFVGLLARRKFDHDTVNAIIAETIDSAQYRLGGHSSLIGLVDKVALRFDELLSDIVIRYVRELSWAHGLALAFSRDESESELARRQIEAGALFGIKRVDLVSYLPTGLLRAVLRLRRRAF